MIPRRTLFALVALLFTALALPGTAQAETVYVQDTNDGYLNLRSGPGTSHGVVMRLTAGTGLAVLGQSGNWLRVALPDGTVGYAYGQYLAPYYTAQRPYDLAVQYTNDGYLNLRAGPGTNYSIIRRLHAGQRLFARAYSGNWAQVQLPDGTTGWASMRYMEPL